MATYNGPSSAELTLIAKEREARMMEGRACFDFMAMESRNASTILWEQEGNDVGLQGVRGYGGAPTRVKQVADRRFEAEPGVYGEFTNITEEELTRRRELGTFGDGATLDSMVMRAQVRQELREWDRIELIIWTLVSTGTFSVIDAEGYLKHTDIFPIQSFTATVPWATFATAVPLQNFRSVQLLSRGRGVSFASDATAYMNRITFNRLVSNSNPADYGGRRVTTALAGGFIPDLTSVLNLQNINAVNLQEGLPQIQIYDQGYNDDADSFTPFIPDNVAIVVGKRPQGQKVGMYVMTKNANNADMAPGSYVIIQDSLDSGMVPRQISIHRGHNGAAIVNYPTAIVKMLV